MTQHYMLTFRIKVVGYDPRKDTNPTFVVRLTKSVNAGSTNATVTETTEKPSNATAAPATNGTAMAAEARAADEPGVKTLKIFDIAQYGSTFAFGVVEASPPQATYFNEVR